MLTSGRGNVGATPSISRSFQAAEPDTDIPLGAAQPSAVKWPLTSVASTSLAKLLVPARMISARSAPKRGALNQLGNIALNNQQTDAPEIRDAIMGGLIIASFQSYQIAAEKLSGAFDRISEVHAGSAGLESVGIADQIGSIRASVLRVKQADVSYVFICTAHVENLTVRMSGLREVPVNKSIAESLPDARSLQSGLLSPGKKYQCAAASRVDPDVLLVCFVIHCSAPPFDCLGWNPHMSDRSSGAFAPRQEAYR
jgi:hypothetical protein